MQLLRAILLYIIVIVVIYDFTVNGSMQSYKVYSKSSSKWRTINFTDPDDDNDDDANTEQSPNGAPSRGKPDTPRISRKFSTPEECARECKVGSRPKTCYYHWTFEYYKTLGG